MSNWELYDLIEAMFPEEIKEFRKSFELEDDEDLEEGDLERILYNYCDIDLDQFYLLIELHFLSLFALSLSNQLMA